MDNNDKESDNDSIAEMLNLVLVCLSKLHLTEKIIRRTRVLIHNTFSNNNMCAD